MAYLYFFPLDVIYVKFVKYFSSRGAPRLGKIRVIGFHFGFGTGLGCRLANSNPKLISRDHLSPTS